MVTAPGLQALKEVLFCHPSLFNSLARETLTDLLALGDEMVEREKLEQMEQEFAELIVASRAAGYATVGLE